MNKLMFPINSELLDACPSLTTYQRGLLKRRHVEKKKVIDISNEYRKSKGTISDQISKAVETYNGWCKLNERKVSQIVDKVETSDRLRPKIVDSDPGVKDLISNSEELRRQNAVAERRRGLRAEIEDEELRRVENRVIDGLCGFGTYVESAILYLYDKVVKYWGRESANGVCDEAFRKAVSFEDWKENEEDNFIDYAKVVVQDLIKEKERSLLLEEYTTEQPLILICGDCQKDGKEVQVEYSPDGVISFICPRCDTTRIRGCLVCTRLDMALETNLRYDIDREEIRCWNCAYRRPVFPLEVRGTSKSRHSRIIQEIRRDSSSLESAIDYADSVVFPVKLNE